MKILYISSSKIPSRTANSIHVMKMCNAWSNAGHQVVLIAQHEKEYYERGVESIHGFYGVKNNFRIVRLPSFSRNLYFSHLYGLLCAGYSTLFRPDVVYGREASGIYLSTLLGYPAVFEIHSPVTLEGFYPRKLVRSEHLRYLVVISQKLKELAKSHANKKHIIVAHDGADAKVEHDNAPAMQFDSSLFSGGFNIGYTGHLYPGKGVEVIVRVSQKLPDFRFHVFGGEEQDIKRLKSTAPGNVFFHGFIPHAAVPLVQQMMDTLILPAQHKVSASGYGATESVLNISDFMSPLKLFEYMRAEKPIIASDIPVLKEVLEHERNALLCPPGEPERWVEAIVRLKNSPQTSEKLARNAKKDFLERYTWQARSEKVLAGL